MSDLIVYKYDSEEKAAEVLAEIAQLKQENVQKALIGIEDAAVAVKKADGKVKVQQTLESAVKGSRIMGGGFWGLLIGLLFGGPLIGALVGIGIYALLGRKIDIGIDNAFIDKLSDEMEAGNSALFLLTVNTPIETVTEAFSKHGGEVFHTSFTQEMADVMEQASQHEDLKDAVEAHNED
ncbi:MAG: DUF1269 domain-containing protein [Chloroflexota bacterium]